MIYLSDQDFLYHVLFLGETPVTEHNGGLILGDIPYEKFALAPRQLVEVWCILKKWMWL